MQIPDNQKDLKKQALELIEICRHSVGQRQAMYRTQRQWIETGKGNGEKSLNNRLYAHTDRLQSYLFSPSDLIFTIDFENYYPKEMLLKAEMAARVLTREWERDNIDITFAEGVKVALDYGACLIKALVEKDDDGKIKKIGSRLVMPWHFGVYNESTTNLHDQEAMCETAYLTLPQAWRRIAHLPDADKLYNRIKSNASPNVDGDGVNSFFHQILSTSQLNTSVTETTSPIPGGVMNLGNGPSDVVVDADLGADVVKFHELTVWDDDSGDWVTIQMFEPDILIAPLFKKTNLFCPETLQYGLIQPNKTPGYIWGRSEVADLTEPQGMLSSFLDDFRRLMGVQFDKFLSFSGQNQITDEIYDQARLAGYINQDQGANVTDLTPKIPDQTIPGIEMIIKLSEDISGFGNILSGQNQPGVRSGVQGETLMKTASPRLRDRSIVVERQCASFGDTTLSALEAKSDKVFWTDPTSGNPEEFLLAQLPDDRRVSVDSHSSSPIYEDDHMNKIGFLHKSQIIGGDSVLDLMRGIPMRDLLKFRYKDMQQQKQQMIEQHPELLTKGKKK